jgi:4-amino-4-deoxy-L-arabinose transferase-like glycosyltransferase
MAPPRAIRAPAARSHEENALRQRHGPMTDDTQVNSPTARLAARPWACILIILAISLALRIGVALWLPGKTVWPDGERYLTVAQNLRTGHGFGTLYENRLSVPTQPLLIAGVQLMFGTGLTALRLFFAALGAATCVVGYLLAKELFGPVAALIAAILLAIYPYYVYLSALFEYPQPLFIFLMSIAFLMLYRFLRFQRTSSLLVSGICIGLAALSVPTALVYVPALLFSLWAGRVPQIGRTAALLLLAAGLPIGVWALRNYAAYGQFILVNQAAGTNFWAANNATYFNFGKNAVIPPCSPANEQQQYCQQLQRLHHRLSTANLSTEQYIAADEAAGWKAGWDFVRESPRRSALLSVRKVLEFWNPQPDATTAGRANGGAARDWISIVSYTPVLLLALVGMRLSAPQTGRLLPIYAYILTFTGVYAVFLPTTRYRLPLDFFLIIFAANSLKRASDLIALRARRPARS